MQQWQTYGHKAVKNILNRQLQSGQLAHAYLFQGPEGIGKKTLASELAKKVLGTEKLENHPDFQILEIEGEISIESARDFVAKLAFKPFLGAKKVAIINNAENLNQQSSNALLKTLEEPNTGTVIILIAGSGRPLPTIVSRCQVFNFSSFTQTQLREFSEQGKIFVDDEIISLSFGSISRLLRLSENKEFLQNEQELMEKYSQIAQMPIAEKILTISQYSEMENNELEKSLLSWLNWQSADLAQQPKNFVKLAALSQSILDIKMNKNKKLLLQSLFLKI